MMEPLLPVMDSDSDQLIIRWAENKDAAWIARMQMAMALETENLALEPFTVQKGVTEVFLNPALGSYLLASRGDSNVGCLLLTPEWSDWRAGTVWWIQSVYVLPGFRSQGIFSAMCEFVWQWVRNNPDAAGIRLYVDNTNTHAQKIYARLGMNGDHYRLFERMK